MSEFDYAASAELYASHGRTGLRYHRFPRAADAIRHVIEKLDPRLLPSVRIDVEDEQYDAAQIRALYDSASYPLTRNYPTP